MERRLSQSQDEEPLFTMDDDDPSDDDRGRLVGNTEEYNRKTRNQNPVSSGLQKSRMGKSATIGLQEDRAPKQKAQLMKKETVLVQNKLFKSFDLSKYTAEDDVGNSGLQPEIDVDLQDDGDNMDFKMSIQDDGHKKKEFKWLSSQQDKNRTENQKLEPKTDDPASESNARLYESVLVSDATSARFDKQKQQQLVSSLLDKNKVQPRNQAKAKISDNYNNKDVIGVLLSDVQDKNEENAGSEDDDIEIDVNLYDDDEDTRSKPFNLAKNITQMSEIIGNKAGTLSFMTLATQMQKEKISTINTSLKSYLQDPRDLKKVFPGTNYQKEDLKRVISNNAIQRRSRGLDLTQIQSRFTGRTFEAVKLDKLKNGKSEKVGSKKDDSDDEDDDGDFDPQHSQSRESGAMEEEMVSNGILNEQSIDCDEAEEVIDPAKLTTKDIMILEGEEVAEYESEIGVEEDGSDSEDGTSKSDSLEEADNVGDAQPNQRKRLLKNKEFREKKREFKAEKRQQRERQRIINMAKLKKKVRGLIESEAELGEIDEEGNEILKVDSEDDQEDEDFDFELEDIEGLIDNIDIEGDEENAREAFRQQMLNEDNRLLKKILQGNYLSNREMQTKLSKDKKLQDRIENLRKMMGLEVDGDKDSILDGEKSPKKLEEGQIDVDHFFEEDSKDADYDKLKKFNSEAKKILKRTDNFRKQAEEDRNNAEEAFKRTLITQQPNDLLENQNKLNKPAEPQKPKNNKIKVSKFINNPQFMELVEKSQVNEKIEKPQAYNFLKK